MSTLSQMLSNKIAIINKEIQDGLAAMPPVDITYFRNTLQISLANMIGAGLLVYLAWGHVNTFATSIWLAVHWSNYAWQMRYISRFIDQVQGRFIVMDIKLWKWYMKYLVINGIIWAFGISILYIPDSVVHQFILFAVLIAIISGYGVITMMLCPVLLFSFAIPSVFVFLFFALSSGDELHYIAAGILVVSVAHNVLVGLRMHRALMGTRRDGQNSQQLAEDMEDQKNVAEGANRAKSMFLAAASHDLRQPVHAMELYIEHLRSSSENLCNATVSGIQSSVDVMQKLLGSLLDISKLDARVIKPEIRDFSLQCIIDSIEQSMRLVAIGKKIRLRMRPASTYVRSDPTLLYSILSNLVSNAIKYTKSGKVLVGCRIRNNLVRIEIWDTGPGIPAEECENIFREFYQLKQDRKGGAHGMGLGLAIVSRLGQLLGHSIQLKSVLGRGSCFSVEVPIGIQADIVPEFAGQPWLTTTEFAGRTILVIDNDRNILTSIGHLLNTWGCRVVPAASGAEAEVLLKNIEKLDAVITNLSLDDRESGLDIIRVMRDRFGASLRCLLIAGETDAQTLTDIHSLDIKVLNKPVPPARLRRTLTECLDM